MLHLRARLALLLLACVLSAGCVENMASLKVALGVVEPPPPPPTFLPPEARAVANVTTVLTGIPVSFSSEGSRDPQGLPLTFTWRFGGAATRSGAIVAYAFETPGEWRVTLNVTNAAGLGHEATVVVQVAQANRPPVAHLLVQDRSGRALDVAEMGVPVRFVATQSTDADGDALSYEWDFGDGATSHDGAALHAFDKPGLYTVKLLVRDAAGNAATASRLVAVNGAWSFSGAFAPAGDSSAARAFLVPEGARAVTATLRFGANLGGHELDLALLDAAGTRAGFAGDEVAAGTQGQQARDITVAGDALRAFKAGEWRAEIVRERGVQPEWTLDVRVTF